MATAIDKQRVASHIAAVIAGQEERCTADVALGVTHIAHGVHAQHVGRIIGLSGGEFFVGFSGCAGADGVAADAMGRPFTRG